MKAVMEVATPTIVRTRRGSRKVHEFIPCLFDFRDSADQAYSLDSTAFKHGICSQFHISPHSSHSVKPIPTN